MAPTQYEHVQRTAPHPDIHSAKDGRISLEISEWENVWSTMSPEITIIPCTRMPTKKETKEGLIQELSDRWVLSVPKALGDKLLEQEEKRQTGSTIALRSIIIRKM